MAVAMRQQAVESFFIVSLLIAATLIWTLGSLLDLKPVKGCADLMLLTGIGGALVTILGCLS